MQSKHGFSRRRFLAAGALASGAMAIPAVLTRRLWAKPDLEPVPDAELEKIESALPESATAKPRQPHRILVFYRCEGFVHSSINRGNATLELMGQKTGAFETVVSKDMTVFNSSALDEFDAVVFNNTTRLKFEDPKSRKALMDFVRGGKAVVGIHAATDNFYDWPEAAAMMGGLFDGHPWGAGGTWAVQIEGPEHPLNQAFAGKGFWIQDEIYKLKAPYSRENLRILLGLDMTKKENKPGRADGDNAVAWIRDFGDGRVFYSSLGHRHEIFWTPSVLQHYLDGLQFALFDLNADATPSARLAQRPKICPAPDSGVKRPA
jgi:type 1 glutamine amidotransferase